MLALPPGLCHISTMGMRSIGGMLASAPASSAWQANNLALFVPVRVAGPMVLTQMWWVNGASVDGTKNVDVGLYSADGTRLVSAGNTAQGTANVMQIVDTTDIVIGPGIYYLALGCSSTACTFFRANCGVQSARVLGVVQQTSAMALPATATFAQFNQSAGYIPVIGATTRSVV